MAIYTPETMNFSQKNIIMIISGMPGVGKTTLALSAPNCLLIDADEGIVRVRPEHRGDASIVKTYEELLADVKAAKGQYQTIVVDTCGALIDLMKDWAIRTEPAASRKSGGFSQQGYGIIKTEFLRLSAELRKSFNVVFLFHTVKDKQGEDTFYDIVCEGSAKTMVWQSADLGAYLFIDNNGSRYLGFSPTNSYSAKASYGIRGLVRVPELSDGVTNTFLTKLFDEVKVFIASEGKAFSAEKAMYDAAMKAGMKIIASIDTPDAAMAFSTQIKAIQHALTSEKELKSHFKERLNALGLKWDKEAGAYVAA